MPTVFIKTPPPEVSKCPACGAPHYVLLYVDINNLRKPVLLEDRTEIRCSAGPSVKSEKKAAAWYDLHQSWVEENSSWTENSYETMESEILTWIHENFFFRLDSRSGKIECLPTNQASIAAPILGQGRFGTGQPPERSVSRPDFGQHRKVFTEPQLSHHQEG